MFGKGLLFMKITALNGSVHTDGSTAFLLHEILKNIENAETKFISVPEAIADAKYPFCVSCSNPCTMNCYRGTKLEEAYKAIDWADFVLIGSPVYFGSMTGQLKAFFDKTKAVRAEKRWLGKPMAAVSVGGSKYGGQERTIDHIQSCAMVLGMDIVGNGSTLGMGHFGVSAQAPASEDSFAITQCKSLANAICAYLLNK